MEFHVLINDLHRPGGIIENLPILEIEKEGLTDDLNQADRNKNIELCMQGFHKCFQ